MFIDYITAKEMDAWKALTFKYGADLTPTADGTFSVELSKS